jgi:hypothetical protein
VTIAPQEGTGGVSVNAAREAFHRIRPLFPGARLIVAGAEVPTDPGVIALPGRDAPTFGVALAAANVALFAEGRPTFDPMLIGAMRARCAIAAAPSVRLPLDAAGAITYAATDDPGDLASVLAELFADPALARRAVASGTKHAALYRPERVVAAIAERTPVAAV